MSTIAGPDTIVREAIAPASARSGPGAILTPPHAAGVPTDARSYVELVTLACRWQRRTQVTRHGTRKALPAIAAFGGHVERFMDGAHVAPSHGERLTHHLLNPLEPLLQQAALTRAARPSSRVHAE
jgi:hypothetical protein